MTEAHPVSVLIHILKNERSYVAKFIDWFADKVPGAHQRGLLEYIVEQVPNDRWERRVRDPYAHVELVKSILFHYSGREGIKSEPSKDNLATLIDDYLNSKECLVADAEAEKGDDDDKPGFGEMMEEIGHAK